MATRVEPERNTLTQLCTAPHPNELDRKRIQRALGQRLRYRYVSPSVRPEGDGYRIESPCCSRRIDKEGGVIDIARLEYLADANAWRLYCKDHGGGRWVMEGEYTTLTAVLNRLNEDSGREFWQ